MAIQFNPNVQGLSSSLPATEKKFELRPIGKDDAEYEQIKSYAELLRTSSWGELRKQILGRDGEQCLDCSISHTLNVGGIPIKGLEHYGYSGRGKMLFRPVTAEKHVCLQVHHQYYVLDRLPWNYKAEAFKTLCMDCHEEEHKVHSIPVFLTEKHFQKGIASNINACGKCGGSGYLPEYNYYKSGICFGCDGKGFFRKVEIITRYG